MINFSVTERTSDEIQKFLKNSNIKFSTRKFRPYGTYRWKNNRPCLDFEADVKESDTFTMRQLEILLIKSNIQELEIRLEEERMELKKMKNM